MFNDPFLGNVNRKISKKELIQSIRMNIANELESIFTYDSHIIATDDMVAKRILSSIRDEEKVHIGELFELLKYLDNTTADMFLQGNQEAKEIINEVINN